MIASNKKKKIVNDPVYGFISLSYDIILEIIDHPYFQRLRRIKQLGLTDAVYPGALHTRFHHTIGCTHLMAQAIDTLRLNGHIITPEEAEGVTAAILLHDIGHGPFSHALEYAIVKGLKHEEISVLFMEELNRQMSGKLNLALSIFKNEYPKKFLHQLVSGQLDMDRLDYLKRDSFYTGVSEGVVSNQRIIKMLDVRNDQLVIQEKGIYSIEKFIVARRLMYWQVYLHKTAVSAEVLMKQILKRAKFLAQQQIELFASPALKIFLYQQIGKSDFQKKEILDAFAQLDDYDILGAIKVWCDHSDKVLSNLCKMVRDRQLLKVKMSKQPFSDEEINRVKLSVSEKYSLNPEELEYFFVRHFIENNAYNPQSDRINILYKDESILDITEASDNLNIQALAQPVRKYFLAYPKL